MDTELIQLFGVEKFLELNAKLQKKKNSLRKKLNEKGVLKKEAQNTYDKYKYFSESQYKELFTELFSESELELKFNEVEYKMFAGSEKQANGRMPKLCFTLFDCETGFFENTMITGEAIDKGDKAGYKAYTGALKYYLANTFMVATDDDPEKESVECTQNNEKDKVLIDKVLTQKQINRCYAIAQTNSVDKTSVNKYIQYKYKKSIEKLSRVEYDEICKNLEDTEKASSLIAWMTTKEGILL